MVRSGWHRNKGFWNQMKQQNGRTPSLLGMLSLKWQQQKKLILLKWQQKKLILLKWQQKKIILLKCGMKSFADVKTKVDAFRMGIK